MPLVRLLGERLLSAGGKSIATREALQGASAVGLYFSASWCPPCRGFTPQLIESFKGSLEKKGMKCVLISRDRDVESFTSYYSNMPWFALPLEDQDRNAALGERFGVSSIPNLSLVDPAGKTITTEARNDVARDPEGLEYPWHPPLVRDLAKGDPGRLSEMPSLVCLCESATQAQRRDAEAALVAVASAWAPTRAGPQGEYGYFMASGGPLSERLRELCQLPAEGPPQLIMLDIPDQGGFYLGPNAFEALEEDGIRRALSDYEASRSQRRQLDNSQ
mmetsp:Transcript_181360/g.575614  ORF Transcript_181360/g.575614 Transcript_181360/m.575614 type:complete len:276 (-) Transcript_181360:120-947(-)